MQTNKTNNLTTHKQQGMALVMSLVILLVLTLLGVSAMNTSSLQILMTGNSQYQTSALNTAEDVIRTAEAYVDGYVAGTKAIPSTGYYNIGAGGVAEVDITSLDWTSSDNVVNEGDSQYIVEYTGDSALDSASIAWRQNKGILGDNVSVFRITARSPTSRGAMRYVQSIFVTEKSPQNL